MLTSCVRCRIVRQRLAAQGMQVFGTKGQEIQSYLSRNNTDMRYIIRWDEDGYALEANKDGSSYLILKGKE